MITEDDTREALAETADPLGLDGIEFVEFATRRPQAVGQVLERMGFRPVSRHRSREITRYRQGSMNIVINAHAAVDGGGANGGDEAAPTIAAIALRVRDAGQAHRRAVELGAWPVAPRIEPMELYIPAIHGAGGSRIYFVDRYREFSIYDVDFVPIPTVDPAPPALTGLHWFGVVQYIGLDRMEDWTAFYAQMLGLRALPDDRRFGILNRGRILASPCGGFYLQLIEPEAGLLYMEGDERLQRVAFGTPDVAATVRVTGERGIEFLDSPPSRATERGAITRGYLGGLMFELVRSVRCADASGAA